MKRHHATIVLLLGCTVALVACAEPSFASWRATVDSLYSSAEESFSASDYASAAASYDRVVEVVLANDGAAIGPYFAGLLARSRFLAGRSRERREEWDEAIASIGHTDECPMYNGFIMKDQLGLVPIGREP